MPESKLTGRRQPKYLTDDQRKSLVPGLLSRFSQGSGSQNSHEVARRRMATLRVPANEAPSTFLQPGPFQVVMEGFLRSTEPGKFRLRAAGTGSARIFLKGELVGEFGSRIAKDSKLVGNSVEHDLHGFVPLRVEYAHSETNEVAEFRLFWQREDGLEELIPPTAIFSSGNDQEWQVSEQRRRATDAVVQFRCAKCHEFGSHGAPSRFDVATTDGPSLKFAGDRLNPDWVAMWLLSPGHLRNDATMPALLGNTLDAQLKAAHLAAFVTSLRAVTNPDLPAHDRRATRDDIELGGQLWEQLGCIGCHRLTPVNSPDEFGRTSLQFVAKKFREPALPQFLRRPHADYATTRMPDFQLTEEEAKALSAFLIQPNKPTFLDEMTLPAGDQKEGRKLAESLRCHACHDLGPTVGRDGLAASRKRIGIENRLAGGCLSSIPANNAVAPRFNFTANQRKDLQATLAAVDMGTWQFCAAEESQRLFGSLRCGVCHGRDDQSSQLPNILAEDGQLGWLPDSLPNLTWVGERLRASWMDRFIGGRIVDRPRPHLTVRMPAFPAYAATLAQGFAAQHGIQDEESLAPQSAVTEAELALGYRLTLKDGGLDCRQCHAVGSQPAQGDDKTKLAPGINFAQVPERLRYDFYRRFVLDPPRYDINTRMPKLSADGRTTSVQHIYNGNARRQFDSIWKYLQTIHGAEP